MGDAVNGDLVIVGGGPAGGVLALLAAQSGMEVVLVEAQPPETALNSEDLRNYAIVLGSWRLLGAAGLAPALEPVSVALHGLEASDGVGHGPSVSGARTMATLLFEDADLEHRGEGETLGRMIEARELGAVLEAALQREGRVRRIVPARFEGFAEAGPGRIAARLSNGLTVTAPLMVGADGVNSSVRAAAGVRTVGWEYDQAVVTANVALEAPHNGIARQLFTPEGPFALLPLRGERANLAWYLPRAAAQAVARLGPQDFEAELNRRFSGFAGPMRLISGIQSYPLRLQHAERLSAPRLALLGDAVRRVSPIAGQGLNSGLKDVAALMEVIEDQRRIGLDWGDARALGRYAGWRHFDSLGVALAMDVLTRGFRRTGPVSSALRGLALSAAGRISPLRRLLAGQASADQAALPRRMQRAQG